MTYAKKLIEVALPLVAINAACSREKSIRQGHPSTMHLWWARRPLAAARAVIFAQMVDDPSSHPDIFKGQKAQDKERQRLLQLIEELVLWENTTNDALQSKAREHMWQSWRYACAANADHPRASSLFRRNALPAFHDPFAGGGSLPLEAQRLGMDAYASDLNPVAVVINKAMVEIPARFAGRPPVHSEVVQSKHLFQRPWPRAQGLAEDVRYYGQQVRAEAERRIGALYPQVSVTADMARSRPDLREYVGRSLTAIAWIWARTVKSPNPAFTQMDVPLASSFMLSTKAGKEAYIAPVIKNGDYHFEVRVGKPKDAAAAKNGTKLSRGANFQCLLSGTPIGSEYVYSEAKAGRMGARLLAVVAEGDRQQIYLSPTKDMEAAALQAKPDSRPDLAMPDNPRWFSPPLYGLRTYGDLFTNRQLVALTTFSDLVEEVRTQVERDAAASGLTDDGASFDSGGTGAKAYADAVAVYLALGVGRSANYWSSLTPWGGGFIVQTFGRQAIPMVWDYAEANPFSDSTGNWSGALEWITKVIEDCLPASAGAVVTQADAQTQSISTDKVVSTDPPYYDNIGYADLSDYFYVWLRRSLKAIFPTLFATVAVPKAEELVATPYRHGGKDAAEAFFLTGMTQAMHRLAEQAHPAFPVTIYYAFKQSETEGAAGTASTGWETFLEAVIRAGFGISGTWPIRTERDQGLKTGTNVLASSIILVCRKRPVDAPTVSRRDFVALLKTELPQAVVHLQAGNIAPVDLAQAAIGPGMAVYTRFSKVLDAAGKPLAVREALALINQTLDEALAEREGDFDADSRWALTWFEHSGFAEGDYGVAEQLSKSKNTSVAGMVEGGFLESRRGKVRLLRPAELDPSWDPTTDVRLTAWETVHHLIRVLESEGEDGAAQLVAKLGSRAEPARELAYRLFALSERRKRAAEALSYNGLVLSWPEITRLARQGVKPRSGQVGLFEGDEE